MQQSGHVDSRYALFVALALNLAYVLSYLDRQILTLLIDPIRADLGISDTAISILTGFAFVAIHSIMLVPVGHLADRMNRKRIIVTGIVSWSGFTAACGLPMGYIGLLIARMGVGLGEAALIPPAYSMLADYFSRKNLQKAMSIFVVGAPLGAALALMFGGAAIDVISNYPALYIPGFGHLAPWQTVFVLVGALSIPVLLLFLAVKEPPRKDMMIRDGQADTHLPLSVALRFVKERRKLFVFMISGLVLVNITAYGALTWLPTFFIRTYGWSPADAGIRIGMISLVFGVAGPFGALWLSRYFHNKGLDDATIRVTLTGILLLLPAVILTPLVPGDWAALALTAPMFFGIYIVGGTIPTLIQTITPNQLRARLSGFFVLILNLLGLGLGPTIVALCTDYVFGRDEDLRYAMALVFSITMISGSALIFFALAPFAKASVLAKEWEDVVLGD